MMLPDAQLSFHPWHSAAGEGGCILTELPVHSATFTTVCAKCWECHEERVPALHSFQPEWKSRNQIVTCIIINWDQLLSSLQVEARHYKINRGRWVSWSAPVLRSIIEWRSMIEAEGWCVQVPARNSA